MAAQGVPSAVHIKTGGGRTWAEEVLSTPEDEAPTPVRGDSAAEPGGSRGKKRAAQPDSRKRRRRRTRAASGSEADGVRD